jgi:hypothetical protein
LGQYPQEHREFKGLVPQGPDEISIWMNPGSLYGKYGEGFFCIALTHPVERFREAEERLRKFLT